MMSMELMRGTIAIVEPVYTTYFNVSYIYVIYILLSWAVSVYFNLSAMCDIALYILDQCLDVLVYTNSVMYWIY